MRRNCIITGILSLALMLLSACAAHEDGGMPETMVSDVSQGTVSESGGESNKVELIPDQEKGSQETLSGRDSQVDGELASSEEGEMSDPKISLAAYQKTVEESSTGMVFSLIDLDGDEIPELVAGDRGNDRYYIYTIKGGTVFCLVDSMTTAELTYFEGSGIIATFARWNGGGDEGGYGWQYYQTSAEKTLTDEDIPILSYSYNAIYNEEGVYTGEGATNYFYMEQETDETVYNEILETLGITENDDRLCLENAVVAEEILDLLR